MSQLVIIFVILIVAGLFWLSSKAFGFSLKFNRLSSQSMIQQVEIDHLQIYKTVVQNSPNLFVIVDQSLQVLVANKTAKKYGWKTSSGFLDANISETSKLHFEFAIKKVLKDGLHQDGEIRLVHDQDNEECWKYFLYHIVPVCDDLGVAIGVTITALDVTAQREAESELYKQREFIEGILNAIPDAIYVKDDHQRYIYGNNAFSKLVDKELEDYIDQRDEQVFNLKHANNFKRQDYEVLRTNVSHEVEEEISNFKGELLTVLSKRIPFEFQNGRKVLIAIMRDFSDRKRLERELHISKVKQEEASRLATLGETAGGIAHEINNPLNVIVGIAELLKAKSESNSHLEKERFEDYCDRLVKYSMRIAKIIKGLRSISRDASKDPLSDVSFNLLIDETLELCRQQFSSRGIDLQFKISNEDIIVLGRFAQLSQILMNLLNNARDAVEGFENPKIYIEILKLGQNGVLRVWDSGPGVPKEIENQIMKPFFTTKPAGKGTGLGLSISKSIAHEHQGEFMLNRRISNSCFELHIPLASEQTKKSA